MYALETYERDGFTAKVYQDETPVSPADWDNLGELVAFSPPWREFRFAERESTRDEDDAVERGGFPLLARYLSMTAGAFAVPFHFHDYGSSGSRLYATDRDDGNLSGFIVTTHPRVTELCGDDPRFHEREWIEDALRGELEVWGQYVEGDVYGVVIEGYLPLRGRTILESVWGMYGFEYACEEARTMLEYEVNYHREQAPKIAAAFAR